MSSNPLSCSYPDCLHLEYGVGKDPIIELLNYVIDPLDFLNNSLEKFSKDLEEDLEELTLKQSEFDEYFLKNKGSMGFVTCFSYYNEYEKFKEIKNKRIHSKDS